MTIVPDPSVLACLMLICAVAGGAKGLTGFGGALVMAPLSSLLVPAHDVVTLVVLVHCATSLQGVRQWRGAVRWGAVVPLGCIALVATVLAEYCLVGINTLLARRLVATAVLLVTAAHIMGWRWQHGGGWLPTFVAGAFSGVLTAIGGLGGPPAVYYFNSLGQGAALRANLLAYFMVLFTGASLLLLMENQLRIDLVVTALFLIPAFAMGASLGERYSKRLPARYFDALVSALLLLSGLVALLAG